MEYLEHLSKDKKLKKIIALQNPYILARQKNVYLHLCGSIMSQQLNTKVAAVIYARFLNLYKSKKPSPQQIIDTPFETLRGIGLSFENFVITTQEGLLVLYGFYLIRH